MLLKRSSLVLLTIVVLALFLRVYGINWDQNQHLHPDERFLTMTTEKLEVDESFTKYLDPRTSTMNPYNKDVSFYVYGLLPITIVKLAAIYTNNHSYGGIALIGRFISALFDIGTVLFIYKLLLLLKKRIKMPWFVVFLGPLFYAIFVLGIQLSHFFTVDVFLNFFTLAALYFSLRFFNDQNKFDVILTAIFLGVALASKISAVYILPLLLFLVVVPRKRMGFLSREYILKKSVVLLLIGIFSYGTLRIADPHLFASHNLFNPSISSQFINNIKELSHFASSSAGYFPPSIQWYGRMPFLFAITNLAIFGVGIPLTLFAILGIALLLKRGKLEIRVIIFWSLLFFLFQSARFSPSMRYFIILYPLLAIFAAYGFYVFLQRFKSQRIKMTIAITMILLFLSWPIGFISIYRKLHSRVQASYWINQNIPAGSIIATEHWDDGLPLRLPDIDNNSYNLVSLPVFGEDTEQKWQEINTALEKSNYIIFSSNRGYGSIMRVPTMYPKMAQWYEDLFAGKLSFQRIKEFSSFPTWCMPFSAYCISFDDQWSEEAFTVYDHPKVTIFKK
ncbi:hypothetical protein A2690_00250 [Candidatus Roizmanbacteria bacterium RIFCSPHIGHO2_01_FULL_39_12b]|uniref:Glycosyltransferase RgtA/B/C/D-like domain-containing protein n=1 Tax=Candidatus Roizmanbacteria bacterium RIFCSPHIGHO2_01_FULL_39_12b TaxID=1802030 RepID=A0A1F7G8X8_9BACT|nr:MAG: hypothetical protein A2690_00250 [Candidatus Roizmanbacteria bacterium RIFCSPHIGHO2_01_FULL_39_12b]OGK45998.1 MAG: hypothetical protein A3B46_00540 [Candidatus Roizmanbacteria bacterium RIFCSPLOWO2_01_FULL_39_19]